MVRVLRRIERRWTTALCHAVHAVANRGCVWQAAGILLIRSQRRPLSTHHGCEVVPWWLGPQLLRGQRPKVWRYRLAMGLAMGHKVGRARCRLSRRGEVGPGGGLRQGRALNGPVGLYHGQAIRAVGFGRTLERAPLLLSVQDSALLERCLVGRSMCRGRGSRGS
jgi:hypothetical protein